KPYRPITTKLATKVFIPISQPAKYVTTQAISHHAAMLMPMDVNQVRPLALCLPLRRTLISRTRVLARTNSVMPIQLPTNQIIVHAKLGSNQSIIAKFPVRNRARSLGFVLVTAAPDRLPGSGFHHRSARADGS